MGVCAVSACDLSQGPSDVAGTLYSEEMSYIEGPGERIVTGQFNDLKLAISPAFGAYLLARSGSSLAIIDVAKRSFCSIPDVANFDTYSVYKTGGPPLIAYLTDSDERGSGTLHFAGLDCQTREIAIANVTLPMQDFWPDAPVVVRSGNALVWANPWQGSSKTLVNEVTDIVSVYDGRDNATNHAWMIHGDGQLILFNANWEEVARVANVQDVLLPKRLVHSEIQEAVFTDAEGIKRLTIDFKNLTKPTISLNRVGSCSIARGGYDAMGIEAADVFRCDAEGIRVLGRSDEDLEFNVDVDVRVARVLSYYRNQAPMLAYLRNVEPGTHVGSLFVATGTLSADAPEFLRDIYEPLPFATEQHIADHVDLDWLQGSPDGAYVLDQVQGETGRLIRFDFLETAYEEPNQRLMQTPKPVAERVLRQLDASFTSVPYPALDYKLIMANWDGVAGDLTAPCDKDHCDAPSVAQVRVERVPRNDFYVDKFDLSDTRRSYASLVLSDFDGSTGSLRHAPRNLYRAQDLPIVAERVPPGKFQLLDDIGLIGAAYVKQTGADPGVGLLEYWNTPLQATGTIHHRVSEFVPVPWPARGIVYIVPDGNDAGIWFARAK